MSAAFDGQFVISDFHHFQNEIKNIHTECGKWKDGNCADYTDYLRNEFISNLGNVSYLFWKFWIFCLFFLNTWNFKKFCSWKKSGNFWVKFWKKRNEPGIMGRFDLLDRWSALWVWRCGANVHHASTLKSDYLCVSSQRVRLARKA